MSKLTLRGLVPERFFAKYWQKQPGFLRQGLPEAQGVIDPDTLAGLALHDGIESRLVWERGPEKPWQVQHGPFAEEQLQTLPETGWSLLVQGVEQHIPKVARLLKAFQFIPRWRLDDIMISVAPPGGSVGPHYDLYDVFLVQIAGERTWHVAEGSAAGAALLPNADLRILKNMPKGHTVKVVPGDVLYIPPYCAHWGVADQVSLTLSVGFRAPLWRAVADQLGAQLFNQFTAEERWFDQGFNYTTTPDFELNPQAIAQVLQRFSAKQSFENHVIQAFAETVTGSLYAPEIKKVSFERALKEQKSWVRDPSVSLVGYAVSQGERGLTVNGETIFYPSRLHDMVRQLCAYEPVPAKVWGVWLTKPERRDLLQKLWARGAWSLIRSKTQ